MKSGKLYILRNNQKKSLKKYTITQLSQYNEIGYIVKMDTIFMNLKSRKTSKPHVLILGFTDKLDLRRGENRIALSNISTFCTGKKDKRLKQ